MVSNPQPEISVIIPLYKSARYLREALESISNQTYGSQGKNPFEVLLIIDGECENFEDNIPPQIRPALKIHKIEHRGVSGARNCGIEKSSAKFIAFLDADDIWCPSKIARQMEAFRKSPQAGLVYTNSFWIDKSGKVLKRTQEKQYGKLPQGRIHLDMMERDYIITSSMLIGKDVFAKVGLFDTGLEVCEDWELKIRIAREFEVVSVPEPLIYYRLHAGGSHYQCEKMLECGYKVFDAHIQPLETTESGNGRLEKLKANISLNLAGSRLYIDQPGEARKYLAESFRWNKKSLRLYLMYFLSLFPKPARDFLLEMRDRIPLFP